MLFKREPARILAVISAGLALAIGFGLSVSGQQVNLIMVFSSAVIMLLAGEATRSQVVAKPVADKQIEIAKATSIDTPTQDIIAQAKKETE